MPVAILVNVKCLSCNEHHSLCLDNATDMSMTRWYKYKCPVTFEYQRFQPNQAATILNKRPNDVVMLEEISEQG